MAIDLAGLITAAQKLTAAAREEQEHTNAEARAYLAATDWYSLRLQETGEPIPEDVLEKRQAARASVIHV